LAWERLDTARGTSCRVLHGGRGRPLVYLHGSGGLLEGAEGGLLAGLAENHEVYAPELPGFGESSGEEQLEDMLDFTLHGWDVVDRLGLDRPVLVGHSMGGMIASEMACVCPERVEYLALLAPAGLWLDEAPAADIFGVLPQALPALLFHDPASGAAILTGGVDFTDDEALVGFFVDNARRLGTAGKLLFPIPNRRLSKRIYRLRARTVIIWGESDQVMVPSYAQRWKELVPHGEVVLVPEAGHMVPLEQPGAVIEALAKLEVG
jgi:pimeloyl-ACP methyl ester carboxylesterase